MRFGGVYANADIFQQTPVMLTGGRKIISPAHQYVLRQRYECYYSNAQLISSLLLFHLILHGFPQTKTEGSVVSERIMI